MIHTWTTTKILCVLFKTKTRIIFIIYVICALRYHLIQPFSFPAAAADVMRVWGFFFLLCSISKYREMSHITSWESLSILNIITQLKFNIWHDDLVFKWPFFAGILVLAELNECTMNMMNVCVFFIDYCCCCCWISKWMFSSDFGFIIRSRTWHRSYKE